MLQQYTKFVTTDEQTTAQAELNAKSAGWSTPSGELCAYIANQAQAVAPEPEVQFIDIDGFYNYKALANGETIAIITHDSDNFVTQPWVVIVGEVEVHRADTWAKCAHYIQWHYKLGTLPKLKTRLPEELLDLPFDELTSVEWDLLKQYKPQFDCFAAA